MLTGYKPLEVNTKSVYDRHIKKLPAALPSTMFFQGLYAWNLVSGHGWREVGPYLCIVAYDPWAPGHIALPPLGPLGGERFAGAVGTVYDDLAAVGERCVFNEVPGFMMPAFEALCGYDKEVTDSRAECDYLFTLEDFSGSFEKPSARHAQSHLQRHHDVAYRPLEAAHRRDVLDITAQCYCRHHTCAECVFGCEMWVVGRLMEAFEALGLVGVLVYVDGEPAAFEVACRQKDTLFCLIKKVRRGLRGINELVNRAMVELCGAGCAKVNYSDDMGLEGLRSYKTRLGPHTLAPRYKVGLQRV